jgi:type VI secretion system protein ImpK
MAHQAATNSLLECSAELFALAAPLRSGRTSSELPDNFRERVMAGFDTLERMAFERQIPSSVTEDAKYALAAYIDEAVITSEWAGRTDWMSQPLQLELFGEHLAGEGFFRRLAELRQGGEANTELLELYYVCLQLGFEGMYRMHGLEQLMALQVDLRKQLEDYRGVPEHRLSRHGTPDNGILQRVGKHLPYWVIASVTGAVLVAGYSGYIAAIESRTESARGRLSDSVETIPYNGVRGTSPTNQAGGTEAES